MLQENVTVKNVKIMSIKNPAGDRQGKKST
jgi:hypothetical protein